VRYLAVEEVLEINGLVMGGRQALRDRGLLESAVARPRASALGADAYADAVSRGAALLHSLVPHRPFVDGNKRTAVLAILVFADLNDYAVVWDQDEALDFVLRLADGQLRLEDVIVSLRDRMHRKK
jgi:death-on-curing protein